MDAGLLSFVDDLEKSLEETTPLTSTTNTNNNPLQYEGFKVEADVVVPSSSSAAPQPQQQQTQLLALPPLESSQSTSAQQNHGSTPQQMNTAAPAAVPIMMVPQAQAQMGQMVMMPTADGQMQPMMMIPMNPQMMGGTYAPPAVTGDNNNSNNNSGNQAPIVMVPQQQQGQQQFMMPMMMPVVPQQPSDQQQQQNSGSATPFNSSNSNAGVFSGNSANLEGSNNTNTNPLVGMLAAAGMPPTTVLNNGNGSSVQRTPSNNFNSVGSSLGYTSGTSNQGVFSSPTTENPPTMMMSNNTNNISAPFGIISKSANGSLMNSASASPKNSIPPSPREAGGGGGQSGVEFRPSYELGDEGPKQLIVNYISAQVNEAELQQVFEKFGAVDTAKILYDKQTGGTKGYGFVYYFHSKAATKAVKSLQGYELKGKFLKVGYANPQRPPPSTTQPKPVAHFQQQQQPTTTSSFQQTPMVMNPAAPSYQPATATRFTEATTQQQVTVDPTMLFQLQ